MRFNSIYRLTESKEFCKKRFRSGLFSGLPSESNMLSHGPRGGMSAGCSMGPTVC